MEDLKNGLQGLMILLVGYVVLFLTYFVENENLHNVTYVIMWLWLVILGVGAFSREEKKEHKKTINNKALVVFLRALLFGQPLVAIYFGDMWLGVLWLIFSIILILNKIGKKEDKIKD